ncbi:MAG: anion permease, partial [Psychromonas sp.]|nr:anion permease [Psychromonas sp.]
YALCNQNDLDTRLLMMVATVCASYAFMLPIATPPNAIAMSSGAVKVKSMMKYGVLLNLLGIFLVSLFAYGYWRFFIN